MEFVVFVVALIVVDVLAMRFGVDSRDLRLNRHDPWPVGR
jgi:hypothetical protein